MSALEESKEGRTTRASSRRSEIEVVHSTLGKKTELFSKNGKTVSRNKTKNCRDTASGKTTLSPIDKKEAVKDKTRKHRGTMKKQPVKSTTKEKKAVQNVKKNGDSISPKKTTSPAIVKESVLDETKNGDFTSNKEGASSPTDVKEAVQKETQNDDCILDKEIILIPSVKRSCTVVLKKLVLDETNNDDCASSDETAPTPTVKEEADEECTSSKETPQLLKDERDAVRNETKYGRGLRKRSPGYLKRKLEFMDNLASRRPSLQHPQKNTTSARKSLENVKVVARKRGGPGTLRQKSNASKRDNSSKNNMALSFKEENDICELLRKRSEKGVPLTILKIRAMVCDYLRKRGRVVPLFNRNMPGIDWYRGFKKRHSKEFDDILTVPRPVSLTGSSSNENDSDEKKREATKPMPPPRYALSPREERDIVEMLIRRTESGKPLSAMKVRLMVRDYLNKLGRQNSVFTNNMPGKKWFESFKRRHGDAFKKDPSGNPTPVKSEYFSIPKEKIIVEEDFVVGQSVLSPAEEKGIVRILKNRVESGISLHYLDVRRIVRDYLNKHGRRKSVFANNMPGVKWYASFKKRHQEIFNLPSGRGSSRLQYAETNVPSAFEEKMKGKSQNAAEGKQVSKKLGKSVQPTAMTLEEEKDIAHQIVRRAESGISTKFVTVRALVRDYLNKHGRVVPQFVNNRPGKKWYTKFRKRHQGILTQNVFQGKSNEKKSKNEKKISDRIGKTALAPEEEKEIVRLLLKEAKKRKPMKSLAIRKFVRDYLNERGQIVPVFKNNMPGNDWFMAFRTRHKVVGSLASLQEKSLTDSSFKNSDSSSMADESELIEDVDEVSPEISSDEGEESTKYNESSIQITLTPEEEKDIVQQISECVKWGMQLTPLHVRIIVRDFLDKCGRVVLQFPNNMPPLNWYDSFMSRHEELNDILAKSTCEDNKNDDSLREVDQPQPTASPEDQKCTDEDATDVLLTKCDEKEPIIIKIA